MKIQCLKNYFSKLEIALRTISFILIILSFSIFDRSNYLAFFASLIGVSGSILNAKGNPIGQVLTIIFSILYGIEAFTFAYYGEMVTYLGMTLPMAIVALISWLRNPYKGNKAEVKVNKLSYKEFILLSALTVVATVAFYFLLEHFETVNIIPSTISVATSFIAVYLTFRRSPYFPLAYAVNDVVLIVLWVMATLSDISYLSVTICFAMLLVNDFYGFINWIKIRKRQNSNVDEKADEQMSSDNNG